jgi:hypothetical protein
VEAAVELLIGHALWLCRKDFVERAVEFGRGVDGLVLAVIDWEAAVAALDAGRLPCSGSEGQVLRLAAGIAEGLAVDLGSALSGLDERNAVLVAAAVLHAAGHRVRGGQLGGWGGRW